MAAKVKGKVHRRAVRLALTNRQETHLEVSDMKRLRFSIVTRIRGTTQFVRLEDRETKLRWFGLGMWIHF